jgi:hypothetical protein
MKNQKQSKKQILELLVNSIKETTALELSPKLEERHAFYDGEGTSVTRRTIKGNLRGNPIRASYLPYQCPPRDYRLSIDGHAFPEDFAKRIIKILERKYDVFLEEKEKTKIEGIIKGESK